MHKRINLQSSLCLRLSTELLTNDVLMQHRTPDKSAVCCALCLKLMFESLHDQRGSFPSALRKYTFICSKLAQTYWELVQLVFRTFPQHSSPQREELTDSKTCSVTDSLSD